MAADQDPRKQKAWRIKGKYGITIEQYDAMMAAQDGRCAICGVLPTRHLCVDHDHETGEVRGLLCEPCNFALGHMADDVDRLLAAAAYLLARRDVLAQERADT